MTGFEGDDPRRVIAEWVVERKDGSVAGRGPDVLTAWHMASEGGRLTMSAMLRAGYCARRFIGRAGGIESAGSALNAAAVRTLDRQINIEREKLMRDQVIRHVAGRVALLIVVFTFIGFATGVYFAR